MTHSALAHAALAGGAAATLCLSVGLAGCLPITVALRSQLSERAKEPVACATQAECDAAWQKAIEWVSQRCAFKIRTQTESLVETEGPLPAPNNDVACRLDRIPSGEAGSARLEITARCGNWFGCIPEPLYLRAAFHDEMRAAIAATRVPAAPSQGAQNATLTPRPTVVGVAAQVTLLGVTPSAAGAPSVAAEEPAPVADQAPEPAPGALPAPTAASALTSVPKIVGSRLYSDFRWSVNNLEADVEDIVKSPCHVGELLQDPTFYWTTFGTAAALGTSFGLDEPARRAFREIGDKKGSNLEDWGGLALLSATGALYAYGFALDDARARQYALTGLMSTGVSGLLTSALKVTFGRLRPHEDQGHWKWFKGGSSFVSAATTPAFALAADLSEYADNRWYVAVPAYGVAAAVGLGRMAQDAHWISDIAGSALLGVGTTELFLHLHAMHAADPSRYRVFPIPVRGGVGLGVSVAF